MLLEVLEMFSIFFSMVDSSYRSSVFVRNQEYFIEPNGQQHKIYNVPFSCNKFPTKTEACSRWHRSHPNLLRASCMVYHYCWYSHKLQHTGNTVDLRYSESFRTDQFICCIKNIYQVYHYLKTFRWIF